jgi:signal transduction histidine kinase/CheY-like chemotaxis protein
MLWLDRTLRSPDDDTEGRRIKVIVSTVLMLLLPLFVFLAITAEAVLGLTRTETVQNTLMSVALVAMLGATLWTKRLRVALVCGHIVCLLMLVIVASHVFRNGLRSRSPVDGSDVPYGPQLAPISISIVTVIFRARSIVFAYFALLVIIVCSGFAVPSEYPDDARISNVAQTLVTLTIVVMSLVYFGDVSMELTESVDEAKMLAIAAEKDAVAERRANVAKSRFVSVMSHEIRNPLQAILLQLEMLEATSLSVVQRDYCAGVTRASNVLLAIVNDILDVTKIESGAISLESVRLSLRELIEFTMQTNAPNAASKGLELVTNIDPTLDTSVRGDPTRIRQVLHNFVSNALKFTKQGEVEVTLELVDAHVPVGGSADDSSASFGMSGTGLAHTEDSRMMRLDSADATESGTSLLSDAGEPRMRQRWRLAVRDTGIGIDKTGQEKLFREFSQVDDTTTRMYGGTGLGLFICKELTEVMGGSVSVDSEPGRGSTFTATMLVDESSVAEQLPRCKVAPTIAWVVLVYAVNEALRNQLYRYASYFFASAPSAVIEIASRPREARQRIITCLDQSSPLRRLVVIANYLDCTEQFSSMLLDADPSVCVPITVATNGGTVNHAEVLREGWVHVVAKPVTLGQFCSTLTAALSPSPEEALGTSDSLSSPLTSELARSHGRGDRLGSIGRRHASDDLGSVADEISMSSSAPGGPLVLVVDDFEIVRSLVQLVVSQAGFSTLVAENGKIALALAQQNYERLGLVLMDCEMPIMDGYEATESLRKYEAERGIPPSKRVYVCAMTANAMREDRKRCFASQMSGFLAKPVKRTELQQVLRKRARVLADRGRSKGDTLGLVPSPTAGLTMSTSLSTSTSTSVSHVHSSPARKAKAGGRPKKARKKGVKGASAVARVTPPPSPTFDDRVQIIDDRKVSLE